MVTSKILRLKDLIAYIGLSRSVIYDRMNEGSQRFDPTFPKSFTLGGKAVGWNKDEIDAWLSNCKSGPHNATINTRSNSVSVEKSPPLANASTHSTNTRIKAKTARGSLSTMILEGAEINERILDYLRMPTWTPAMGVMIVCGVAPEIGCKAVPMEAILMDGKPINPSSRPLTEARHLLGLWRDWAEDEKPIVEMSPMRFLNWCQECDIDTDWLRLCLQLTGFDDESKPDLTGARFALLTSKQAI